VAEYFHYSTTGVVGEVGGMGPVMREVHLRCGCVAVWCVVGQDV